MFLDTERRGQFLKSDVVLENFPKEMKFDLRRKWVDEEMKVGNVKEKINLHHSL